VKEKQVEHQKNIIELQDKLKRNQNQVKFICCVFSYDILNGNEHIIILFWKYRYFYAKEKHEQIFICATIVVLVDDDSARPGRRAAQAVARSIRGKTTQRHHSRVLGEKQAKRLMGNHQGV